MALIDRHIQQKDSPMTSAKVKDKLLHLSGPILDLVRLIETKFLAFKATSRRNDTKGLLAH